MAGDFETQKAGSSSTNNTSLNPQTLTTGTGVEVNPNHILFVCTPYELYVIERSVYLTSYPHPRFFFLWRYDTIGYLMGQVSPLRQE